MHVFTATDTYPPKIRKEILGLTDFYEVRKRMNQILWN